MEKHSSIPSVDSRTQRFIRSRRIGAILPLVWNFRDVIARFFIDNVWPSFVSNRIRLYCKLLLLD